MPFAARNNEEFAANLASWIGDVFYDFLPRYGYKSSLLVANVVETPREIVEATAALELLQDVLDDMSQVGPMLRKSIKKEAALDLGELERKIKEILQHQIGLQ